MQANGTITVGSMAKKRYTAAPQMAGNFNLAKEADRRKLKKMTISLEMQTQALTKNDIRNWRQAWQQAISIENPQRIQLYRIYTDALVDLHLSGCIGQRKGFVKKKSFKLVDRKGQENEEVTELFETKWFKNFVELALDSNFWGHSLIELGDVITVDGKMRFDGVKLVPREHVIPEYGVITRNQGEDWTQGFSYREGDMRKWCIEAGEPNSLGILLKMCPQTIAKKNMEIFWNQFGEMFGMPVRIGKTSSRDDKDIKKIESMMEGMGAAAWGLFPEGTEIEIKETSRGDAFNVYDRRIERANSEISKGSLFQTMTIDSGSSLSQSEVHLAIFQNVIDSDADMIRDLINDELIPRMIIHGFPVKGLRFDWDESIDYTPEQQRSIEEMILDRFEVNIQYFIDKYNIPITGKKEEGISLQKPFFD